MSLVNDMLRDLEQRNKKDSVSGPAEPLKAAQTAEFQRQPNSGNGVKFTLGLVALVGLGLLLWLLMSGQFAQLLPVEKNHQNGVSAPDQAEVIPPAEINAPTSTFTEVEKQSAAIRSILWSGTEMGGDLVVRLDGEADIQLLGQDTTSVSIAFEDVQLKTDLPNISGPLIDRIDVFRDNSRTELMLTTKVDSQFAFRVQHTPTTMILGVLPQESTTQPSAEFESKPEPVVEQKQQQPKPLVKTQVTETTTSLPVTIKPAEPIKKTQRAVSDQEANLQARKLIQKGQLNRALEILQKRIKAEPEKSPAARGYLATLQLSAGMGREAKLLLQESVQIHPDDLTLRKLQSRLLLTEGNSAQSLVLLQKSLPEVGKDPEYHELLATAHQQQGQYEAAAKIYYSLLQHQNSTPRWWVGMAYSLELDKRYDEALRAYRSAVQIPGITASLKTYAEQRVKALSGR